MGIQTKIISFFHRNYSCWGSVIRPFAFQQYFREFFPSIQESLKVQMFDYPITTPTQKPEGWTFSWRETLFNQHLMTVGFCHWISSPARKGRNAVFTGNPVVGDDIYSLWQSYNIFTVDTSWYHVLNSIGTYIRSTAVNWWLWLFQPALVKLADLSAAKKSALGANNSGRPASWNASCNERRVLASSGRDAWHQYLVNISICWTVTTTATTILGKQG